MTSGNHIWDKKEIIEYIVKENLLLRPANYPPGTPGAGSIVVKAGPHKVAVLNLMGRVFLPDLDRPFRKADEEVTRLRTETPIIVVDMHAEATSESQAMGWHLDGRVSAVVGTHRHVQTADERLLPKGTAYLTDLGMTGPYESVIGVEAETIVKRFVTGMPSRYETAKGALIAFTRAICSFSTLSSTTSVSRGLSSFSSKAFTPTINFRFASTSCWYTNAASAISRRKNPDSSASIIPPRSAMRSK